MLLALDVGNTNTVVGLYDGGQWLGQWRTRLAAGATADECAAALNSLLGLDGYSLDRVTRVGLASVVPTLTATLRSLARGRLKIEPVVVGPDTAGIRLGYLNPRQLGADRIAGAVAAWERFKRAVIVVDLGTATKFDYVSPQGCFEGGIIAPGLMVTAEALFSRTAQLPQVDALQKVEAVLARDTVSAMTVGLFRGYVNLIRGLLEELKAEVGTRPLVVATGGLAPVLAEQVGLFDRVELDLTLEGIRLILERNQARPGAVGPGAAGGAQ